MSTHRIQGGIFPGRSGSKVVDFCHTFIPGFLLRWGSVSWRGRSWTRRTCWSCWARGRSRRSRRTRSLWRGRAASRRTRVCRRASKTGTWREEEEEEEGRPRRRARLRTNSRPCRAGNSDKDKQTLHIPAAKTSTLTQFHRAWEVEFVIQALNLLCVPSDQ